MIRFVTFILAATLAAICNPADPFPPPRGDYGSPGTHIAGMEKLLEAALETAHQATSAATVDAVKQHADTVFTTIWGSPSGLVEHTGAATMPGWKTRWQVTYSDFDPAFGARYGNAAPRVTDPQELGIAGRGLYVRRTLTAKLKDPNADLSSRAALEQLIAALNNVIGWTRIDDGVTKAERQPRVDLTYQWDAPKAFWQSSADTGWLFEVQAQTLNILKTDYADDLATARQHAEGLVMLIEKCRDGVDANQDGTISPVMMEGGLAAAGEAARKAGLL